jgi:hypothetical protein
LLAAPWLCFKTEPWSALAPMIAYKLPLLAS